MTIVAEIKPAAGLRRTRCDQSTLPFGNFKSPVGRD